MRLNPWLHHKTRLNYEKKLDFKMLISLVHHIFIQGKIRYMTRTYDKTRLWQNVRPRHVFNNTRLNICANQDISLDYKEKINLLICLLQIFIKYLYNTKPNAWPCHKTIQDFKKKVEPQDTYSSLLPKFSCVISYMKLLELKTSLRYTTINTFDHYWKAQFQIVLSFLGWFYSKELRTFYNMKWHENVYITNIWKGSSYSLLSMGSLNSWNEFFV